MHRPLFYRPWTRDSTSSGPIAIQCLRERTFIARSSFAVTRSFFFFCFAHGPPITRLPVPSVVPRNLHVLRAIYQA